MQRGARALAFEIVVLLRILLLVECYTGSGDIDVRIEV
jgi:hypothetical protein